MRRLVVAVMCGVAYGDGSLSEAETSRLLEEAERWRSGFRNGTSDLWRAVEMYEVALERGTGRGARHSAYELGLLYEKGCRWPGIGHGGSGCPVARDVRKSLELYGLAAARGHPSAQLSMAVALTSGAFVLGAPGEVEALDAYARSRARGARGSAAVQSASPAAREDVAVLHEYFGALGGDPLAQMALGWRHLHGAGVPARCDAALEYYEAAADAAVRAMRDEGVLRPNDRARLATDVGAPRSTYGGLNVMAEKLFKASKLAALVDAVAAFADARRHGGDRGVAARVAKWLWDGGATAAAMPKTDPRGTNHDDVDEATDDAPKKGDDAPWRARPGASTTSDFWGVGGSPDRGGDVLHYYRHAADQGDSQAMLMLGHLHYHGSRGVNQNLKLAFDYFLKAASAGDDAAAFGWAGFCYAVGAGVPRDDAKAKHWLLKGEAKGDAVSLNALGVLVLRGSDDDAPDVEAATAYFRRSSEKGFMDALYHLGMVHLGWDGHPDTEDSQVDTFAATVDDDDAPQTQSDAAAADDDDDEQAVADGDTADKDADKDAPPKKMESRLGARRAKGKAAKGRPAGTKSLRVKRKDAQKALQFFSLAAQNGHVSALHRVGRMYARALGVARSCEIAVNAYRTRAGQG